MTSTPLKITFTVQGGFVPPSYPLHLDALLAYAVTQRNMIDLDESADIEVLRALAQELPLDSHEHECQRIWKASAITPAEFVTNDSGFYTQRPDECDLAYRVGAGSVSMSSRKGPLKPYAMQIDTARGVHRKLLDFYPLQRGFDTNSLVLQAWCIGDLGRIEELLTDEWRPTHLGARRRSGHGFIESVKIETDEQAHTLWQRRVRPWSMPGDVSIIAACQAPYWDAANRRSAFIPADL